MAVTERRYLFLVPIRLISQALTATLASPARFRPQRLLRTTPAILASPHCLLLLLLCWLRTFLFCSFPKHQTCSHFCVLSALFKLCRSWARNPTVAFSRLSWNIKHSLKLKRRRLLFKGSYMRDSACRWNMPKLALLSSVLLVEELFSLTLATGNVPRR